MIEKILGPLPVSPERYTLYAIGDRASDIEMGLNAGGVGILVESAKTRELGDVERVRLMGPRALLATSFLEAARQIYAASLQT